MFKVNSTIKSQTRSVSSKTQKKSNDVEKKPSEQTSGIIFNITSAFGAHMTKGKAINFKVHLRCTDEKFNVIKFPIAMKIRDLKACLEFICGIPYNLQRLSYLDDGELDDGKDVQYYDVIDGAVLEMDIWTIYVGLVKACVFGNIDDVLKQGVSLKVEWNSPTSDYMFRKDRVKYISDRSGIALFIASHRGNIQLVKGLLNNGANLNYASSYGRTPIMVAVVANKTEVIDYLLDKNVNIDSSDINGDTALTIAKKFNNKLGQNRLTQYKWKKRTDAEMKNKKPSDEDDEIFTERRLPHQVFDSSKKTWLKGDFMQIYMMQTAPYSEYSGSGLSAPKSVGRRVLKEHRESRSLTELRSLNESTDRSLDDGDISPIQNGLTFDKWLSQKLKAKRLQKQQLKKAENSQSNETKETNSKDSNSLKNDSDNNFWMKDYLRANNQKKSLFDQNFNFSINSSEYKQSNDGQSYKTSKSEKNFMNESLTEDNSSSRSKNVEFLNIYKGMPYDEWISIRDQFLKNHRMLKS